MIRGLRGFPRSLFLLVVVCLIREISVIRGSDVSSLTDSSLFDFSFLLDAPAGKHGCLQTTTDGHFAFADGTRTRLFGISVTRDSIFQSREAIDEMVGRFARAGLNLVRFHHLDERDGIIDYSRPDTRHLREDRLALLDYWMAQLKQRGIYVYLDLLDYRTFKSGDGVRNASALGRGAKPCAVFDAKLIELQREYATQLLGRMNTITKVRYADEPALAMIELFDENGLFRRREWSSLPEPYRGELRARWHGWLRARGYPPAPLPNLSEPEQEPRAAEGARFARQIHVKYFRALRDHLRALGVRAPLTAVGRYDELADLRAVSDELDFIGANFYWDHPFWPRGQEWTIPSLFRNDSPISEAVERAFAPQLCLSKVRGKPLIVREWNYCWPNPHRGGGMIEAAAYASLHDFDALILFDYRAHPPTPGGVNYFDVSLDPCRWRLVALAAQAFLRRDLAPAKTVATQSPTDDEVFRMNGQSRRLTAGAWERRIETAFGGKGLVLPASASAAPTTGPVIRSDTGELLRYSQLGFLQVTTPRFVARAGNLNRGDAVLGPFVCNRLPEVGAVAAASLDGKPLTESARFVLTLTTDNLNTGQRAAMQAGRWMLILPGALPVRSSGCAAAATMEFSRDGRELFKLYQAGGSLELAIDNQKWYLQCDPPGAEVMLGSEPRAIVAVGAQRLALPATARFRYPRDVHHVEVTF